MIIDVNVYVGNYPFRPVRNNTASKLVELLDKHGVDKGCVSSLNGIYYRDVMAGNYELLEEIAPYGNKLIPVCNINPIYADAKEDFRVCIEELGFKGVKLFPKQHGYSLSDEKCTELLKRAAEYGIFVQLPVYVEDLRQRHHLDAMYPLSAEEIKEAVINSPDTKFILSNFSFVSYYGVFNNLSDEQRANIFYDISRIEILYRNHIRDMLKFTSIENLLFGSGAPLEYIDVQLIKMAFLQQKLGITEEEVELVGSKNMMNLLERN